jgi:ApaG protein
MCGATALFILCASCLCLCVQGLKLSRFQQGSVYSTRGLSCGLKSRYAQNPAGAGINEVQRKELWRSISDSEKQAVQLIASVKSGGDKDSAEQRYLEAHKLFAQAAYLKTSDPYVQLLVQYSQAVDRKDAAECDKLLAAMSSVGFPPHVVSVATQLARSSLEATFDRVDDSGTGSMEDASVEEEEVDAGSAFSDTVTDKIRVKVSAFYDAARSEPASGKYMFHYKVAIFNEGSEPVQVVARMWEIEKCKGVKEVVRGSGIMGTQPVISPGDVFNYESVCPLKVFPPRGRRVLGSMSGAYTMCKGNMGQHSFSVKVAKFNLILPDS